MEVWATQTSPDGLFAGAFRSVLRSNPAARDRQLEFLLFKNAPQGLSSTEGPGKEGCPGQESLQPVCLDAFFIQWLLNTNLDTVTLDITGQKSEFTYVNALYWFIVSRLLTVGFGDRVFVWRHINYEAEFILIMSFNLLIFIGLVAVVEAVFGAVRAWIERSIDKSMSKAFQKK